ncbi:3',5'-cyclic AMP phosphodiesterase CpdA [Angulomicrobium tetraedrale]|uniref:3',5'-cyclic AMP phosphodiesterase CpdA n=1 Tax=Ancylobacter tetraedralis TaxID=217068 RepID=A0A839Z170_9HYPH|nr:metallophosphoesterase [Ancylobacter tetraedralis]MBB3769432.1 3',5'-cyclic AMP phosphodiesterase CpdA [Ancylobacter tetraedralis]
MASTIVLVSDTHLSRARPFFQFNWEIFLQAVQANPPDLVLAGGDMALNAPSHPDDLAYAREQLDRLPCPWAMVPGNHDVGNNPPPPETVDTRGETTVSQALIDHYRATIGPDFWARDIDAWRIIGLDSLLCGSGLPAEAEQASFLESAMAEVGKRPVALCFHKPVFRDALGEADIFQGVWYPQARRLIRPHLDSGRVRLVLSGHTHEGRDETHGPTRHVWMPSLAFVTDMLGEWRPNLRGRRRVGWLRLKLGDEIEIVREEPDELLTTDISGWMRSGSIRLYEAFTGHRRFPGLPNDPGH